MKYSELKKILKTHKLRITDSRLDILDFCIKKGEALSLRDLEDAFNEYDRVTLYRTLNSFTDNGIMHRIPDDSGHAKFGVCYDTCTPGVHHHDHMHFKCNQCGKIECLEKHIPAIDLPGYEIHEANLVINGICKTCHLN